MTTTDRVREYLKTTELKRDYTAEIAATMGMSANTIRRYIRQEGTTMAALMREEKIRRMNETLAQRPNINAKRLASHIGYEDVNHFYRAFKHLVGIRWSQYLGGRV